MSVKITATPVTGRQLRPGDLFSVAPQEYWDFAMRQGSVGECVYIRTDIGAERFEDADEPVYRITIQVDES